MAKYINQQNSDAGKQVQMRFPKGVDQVSPETALLPGAARRIVNLDVHQGAVGQDGPVGGRLSSRSQVKLAVAGTNVHSLWSGTDGTFYVDSGALKTLNSDMAATQVRAGVGDSEMFYVDIAGTTYYSNGAITGSYAHGVDKTWGLPVPAAPVLTTTGYGGLTAGNYMVAYTTMDADGYESGASPTSIISVTTGGGIVLNTITTAADHKTRVYVSPANGENLYWVQDSWPGQTTAYVGAHTPGKMLSVMHMSPMEPCTHLETYNGRIYGVVGNALVATQAMNYGLTRPATDFVMFPAEPTMVKSVVDGLYVGTQHDVVFLAGDDLPLFKQKQADALPPIPGSALVVDGGLFGEPGRGIVWLTRRGWVFGSTGGRVKRLTESQMSLPSYDRAAALYREHDGMRQVMTFVKGGGEAAGASDSYTTEIVRNGRVI